MDVKLSYVNGHVEVFDEAGRFMFSADSHREAMDELEMAAQMAREAQRQIRLQMQAQTELVVATAAAAAAVAETQAA
jgi:hypothetical protein